MKMIFHVLLLSTLLYGFGFGQQADTLVYTQPEIRPGFSFDTCTSTLSSVKQFFITHYKMPPVFVDNSYFGSIVTEFIIEKDGSISNIKLIRGIDEPLDNSVINFIRTMPKWEPGINKEKVIRTRFLLPVSIFWLYGKIDD